MIARFRARLERCDDETDPVFAYVDAALKLDERADLTAARCWVGVFAESIRDPKLFAQMRKLIANEITTIQRRSHGQFCAQEAGAVLAFVIGSLVVGAFAPKTTAGFAAPGLRRLVAAMRARG